MVLFSNEIWFIDQYNVIGGGSLKKRLGDNKLSDFEIISDKNYLLLGTSTRFIW